MSERRSRPSGRRDAGGGENGKLRGRRRKGADEKHMHQDDAPDAAPARRRRPKDPPESVAKSTKRRSKKGADALGDMTSARKLLQAVKPGKSASNKNSRQRTRGAPKHADQSGSGSRARHTKLEPAPQDGVGGGFASAIDKQTPNNNDTTMQLQSLSAALSDVARLDNDLQLRRRTALDIATEMNEDGTVECGVLGLGTVDPTMVHKCKFASEKLVVEKAEGDASTEEDGENAEGRGLRLGKNGWHRALDAIASADTGIQSLGSYASESPTLNQMTVSHLLQHHPQIDEMDCMEEEYEHLLTEIKALEKDRVQLEQQFHEVGRLGSARSLRGKQLTYPTYRANLRYMKSEDVKGLPLTWLEDVPLWSPNGRRGSQRRSYAILDEASQDRVRDHRGVGVALLIADAQCKESLVGRCVRSGRRGNDELESSPVMIKREKMATVIEDGGEFMKHFAITGLANATSNEGSGSSVDDLGTAYFVKFDGGKTYHRGALPSNLLARLFHERRDKGSLTYLSTGGSYSVGGGQRCYYAEFDDGECWWGTNQDDDLDRAFTEMDAHRVAFGSCGGWVVLGKDGSARWKNVGMGLHDVLVAQQANGSAPCEVSLGMGGSYFIRFLDGAVDYSLPNFAADVVDALEADGQQIRNVALHADTYDCVIRYSVGETNRCEDR